MDNLPVIILVGLFALGKWLLTNAGKSTSENGGVQPPNAGPPPQRPRTQPSETDEERMRRFMEALGLPAQATPPAKVEPRPAQPPPPLPQIQKSAPEPLTPAQKRFKERPARRSEGRPARRADHKGIAPELAPMIPMDPIAKVASVSETAPSMEVTSIPSINFGSPVEDAEDAVSAAGNVDRLQSAEPTQRGRTAFRGQLRGSAALRKALVMREILGPPKALQSQKASSTLLRL